MRNDLKCNLPFNVHNKVNEEISICTTKEDFQEGSITLQTGWYINILLLKYPSLIQSCTKWSMKFLQRRWRGNQFANPTARVGHTKWLEHVTTVRKESWNWHKNVYEEGGSFYTCQLFTKVRNPNIFSEALLHFMYDLCYKMNRLWFYRYIRHVSIW